MTRSYEITNRLGLHARAAAQLVQIASGFSAEFTLRKGEQSVNGKSIMGVMTLAAEFGSELELVADGVDEEFLIDEISELFASKFGEE